MHSRYLLRLSGLLVLSVALLAGGLNAQSQDEPQAGGQLNVALTQEIQNLDPHVATGFSSFRVMEHVYEGLLRYNNQMELQPALATSWEVSDDGTVYTFQLREGVTFHDGSDLTAADVVASFERVLDPETESPQRSRIEAIDTIEVVGPTEVRFTLSRPFSPFLSTMPLISIVPENFAEKVEDPRRATLGTGPFTLAEFGPDFVQLTKNEDYWAEGLPYLDGIRIRQIPDASTLRAALRTGQVDLIFGFGVDVNTAGAFAGLADFNVFSVPGLNYSLMGIQNEREPFDDVRVRRALSLAIDRQQIVETVYFGRAAEAGPIPPASEEWGPMAASDLPNYGQNLERARSLLDDAGVEDLTFNMMPIPTVPEANQIAQVIQQQLERIDVTVEIESVEFGTFLDRWRGSDFDTFISLNGGEIDPDLHLFRHVNSEGSTNVFQFADDRVDELLEDGRTTSGIDARRAVYGDLQTRLAEQVPFLFLTYPEVFAVASSDVQGFEVRPTQSIEALRSTWLDR